MANDKPTSVWLNAEMKRRIGALAKRMSGKGDFAAMVGSGTVSQSAVLRLAILRGLDALETEHGGGRSNKRAK